MDYVLYCYESKIGDPHVEEAKEILHTLDVDMPDNLQNQRTRLSIILALMHANPKIYSSLFEAGKQLDELTEEEFTHYMEYVELKFLHEPIEFELYRNIVMVNIPFWRPGEEVVPLFKKINENLRIISHAAGYLAYDPNTGIAFDPWKTDLAEIANIFVTTPEIRDIAREKFSGN